jgi:integrase
MSKTGSLGYQIEAVFKKIFKPGRSRHQDKAMKRADHFIIGIGDMETKLADGYRFARFVQRHWPDVKRPEQITPAMAMAYHEYLVANERAGGYIGRIHATLRELDHALRYLRHVPADRPPLLPYADEDGPQGYHSDARALFSTDEDVEQLLTVIEQHDPVCARVLKLAYVTGLRVTEAVYLRAGDIDLENRLVRLKGNINRTKGGRSRNVEFAQHSIPFMAELQQIGEAQPDGHIFRSRRSLAERTRSLLRQVRKESNLPSFTPHSFRKGYAVNTYLDQRAAGQTDAQSLLHVSHQLGHNRTEVTQHNYVPTSVRDNKKEDE